MCYDICPLPILQSVSAPSSWSTILWVVLSPSLEVLTHLGSHTVLQYQSLGRTRDLYALSLTLLELILRFLFSKPSIWFALEVTELICAFHLRSWLIFTPKYLICGTEERVWPWRVCMLDRCFSSGDMYNFTLLWVESHLAVWFPVFQVDEIILEFWTVRRVVNG